MDILKYINSDNGLWLYKPYIKMFGLDSTNIIGYFAKLQVDNQWYTVTYQEIENELGIKQFTIRKCIKQLIANKVLSSRTKGIPSRVFYHLDESIVNVFKQVK